jgi:DNA-binding CsgD family transcriptional regulator/PAS domain-containing protein
MSREGIVLDLIERIYAAAEDPRLWAVFLERLAQIVQGTVTAMVSEDFRAGQPSLAAGARLDSVLSRAYKEYLAFRNGKSSDAGAGLKTGDVVTSQTMPPFRDPAERKSYDELLRKLNVRHLLGAIVFREQDRVSWVSVLRPGRSGVFGNEDVALLQTLLPHLQRALDLQARLAEQLCELAAAVEVLDGVPVGIVLLDRLGKALIVNRAASEMFASKDGLVVGPEGLTAATVEENRALRRLVAEAAGANVTSGSGSDGALAVSRLSPRRAFSVLVKRINGPESTFSQARPAVAAFVIDPDRRVKADGDVLRCLYGFTPAECRVAAELMQGESVEEAARDLDVSLNTARTHMKHLFEKTETHRHRELVRLLLCSSCCSCASLTPRNAHHNPLRLRNRSNPPPPALS